MVWRALPQARGPQCSLGTLRKSPAQPLASRWVAVTGAPAPQPRPPQRLVQTLSSCRPCWHQRPRGPGTAAHTSAQLTHICSCAHLYASHTVLLMYMSYTCSHMSCTCSSAHINICTAHVCSHVRLVNHRSLRQWCGLKALHCFMRSLSGTWEALENGPRCRRQGPAEARDMA